MKFKKGQKVRVYHRSNSVWSGADMVVSKPPKDGIVICDHPSHGSGGFWVDQLYAVPAAMSPKAMALRDLALFLGIITTVVAYCGLVGYLVTSYRSVMPMVFMVFLPFFLGIFYFFYRMQLDHYKRMGKK